MKTTAMVDLDKVPGRESPARPRNLQLCNEELIMSDKLQKENDSLVEQVRTLANTDARLSMVASSAAHARGLHIHLRLGQDHFVDPEIRDPKILAEVVKAFEAGCRFGSDNGIRRNQAILREAFGLSTDADGFFRDFDRD